MINFTKEKSAYQEFQTKESKEQLFPVDLVYLWVDNSDEDWLQKKNSLLEKYQHCNKDSINDCRFEDNDELKYSLRSVEKNAPWINNIYIITDNQTPKWLNPNNNKVKIINHSDIIPNEYLPLFNSCAIEIGIPLIKDLSENFLYANDDMFIWNEVSPEFFFKENKVIFRTGKKIKNREYKHIYGYTINNAYKLIKSKYGLDVPYFPHHGIDAYKKSIFLDCFNEFKERFTETLKHPFREFSDLQRIIVLYYTIYREKGILKPAEDGLIFKKTDSLCFKLNKSKLKKALKSKTKLLCINDSRKTNPEDKKILKEILEQKFPKKSSFEL